jgi:hypothetical protein
MNVNARPKASAKSVAKEESSDEEDDADANDPDNYPDAERDDEDEEGLKRRYTNALREQGIVVDVDDPTVAQMMAQVQRSVR